jgi:C-terminal processing protease CtpA/Prc
LDVTLTNGKAKSVSIKNYDPYYEDSVAGKRPSGNQLIRRTEKHGRFDNDRRLIIDTARSLALMELNTFSHARLPSFFRKSFRNIKKQKIKNLVIELRENGGGNIINSTRLARYISDHPFKVADTVAATSLKFPYPSLVRNGFIYKFQSWFVTSRKDDGRLHYRMYEKKYFTPYEKHHFDGKVFLLTGGFTFSASTLFIDPLVGQKNVIIIGEETGGGAYGNTAVNVPDLTLPNTGIRVRLPLYRLVADKNLPHNGRGIMPDIFVPPTSWHLAKRIDPKMLKVYELIGSK